MGGSNYLYNHVFFNSIKHDIEFLWEEIKITKQLNFKSVKVNFIHQ